MAKKQKKTTKKDKTPAAGARKKVAAKDAGELTEDQLTSVTGGVATSVGRVFPKVEHKILSFGTTDILTTELIDHKFQK